MTGHERGPSGTGGAYRDLAVRVEGCHGGRGAVHVARPYARVPGSPLVDFIDFVVVPPGSEIGRHRHGDDEEWYLIAGGSGTMFLEGRAVPVTSGDVVVNRPHGEHGLVNHSSDDLYLLVFQTSPAPGGAHQSAP
jgi:oxalate decarboxylase/phosphoglucose isomerase-like protein (cupin superfamily)